MKEVSQLPQVLRISLVAHFFNAFLLGTAGGDVVKAWYAARATPAKKPEAALTVFADRLLGTLALLLFAMLLLVPNFGLVLAYKRHAAVAALIGAMLVAAAGLVIVGFLSDDTRPQGDGRGVGLEEITSVTFNGRGELKLYEGTFPKGKTGTFGPFTPEPPCWGTLTIAFPSPP